MEKDRITNIYHFGDKTIGGPFDIVDTFLWFKGFNNITRSDKKIMLEQFKAIAATDGYLNHKVLIVVSRMDNLIEEGEEGVYDKQKIFSTFKYIENIWIDRLQLNGLEPILVHYH